MRPIRVLLAHRDAWYRGVTRIDGFFQYPVPEFEWQHYNLHKAFKEDLHQWREFDIVFWDDGSHKPNAEFIPHAPHFTYLCPQVVMYALYPTLSESHYQDRVELAKRNADAVLVDHDDLGRWERDTGLRCRRMAYCTNEYLYRDRGWVRDIDVGFYCIYGWNKERPALDAWLEDYCRRKGYTYRSTKGENVGLEYAELLSRTKVVVHMNRTPKTRPPRIFDVAASGAALLSNSMPEVSGEFWQEDMYYWSFLSPCSEEYKEYEEKEIPVYTDEDCIDVIRQLHSLLDVGLWTEMAELGKQYVLGCHTWRVRARQLYMTLLDLFPKLRKGREEWMYGRSV